MYTLSAATRALQIAAQAAKKLGRDPVHAARWQALADRCLTALGSGDRFELADDQPLHLSTLGPIFPFGLDTASNRAKHTVRTAFEALRSAEGWRPGRHELYESEQWPGAAAHLAAAYANVGDGEAAWELLGTGPSSAGVFLSPHEKMDAKGKRQVPWFTTSAGLWISTLNSIFVRVDDHGAALLGAVPEKLKRRCAVIDLLASDGVLVSASIEDGRITNLSARASTPTEWIYRIRSEYVVGRTLTGALVEDKDGWTSVKVQVGTDSTRLITA